MSDFVEFSDFLKLDIRVGKIIQVDDFPKATNPSYKFVLDFGEGLGLKKSSAQLQANYTKEELLNKFALCVVNFKPKQIANTISEVLVLGIPDGKGNCYLVEINPKAQLGGKLY